MAVFADGETLLASWVMFSSVIVGVRVVKRCPVVDYGAKGYTGYRVGANVTDHTAWGAERHRSKNGACVGGGGGLGGRRFKITT